MRKAQEDLEEKVGMSGRMREQTRKGNSYKTVKVPLYVLG